MLLIKLFRLIKAYLFSVLILVVSMFTIHQAHSEQVTGVTGKYYEVKAGDILEMPARKGNFSLLLWGNSPVWYDANKENFSVMPIRNYGTTYVQITRQTPPGDYQFVEIDADGDPTSIFNWRWIRINDVRVLKCDGFGIC